MKVFLCDLDGEVVSCSQVNFTFRVRIPAFAIKDFEDFLCSNIVPIICGAMLLQKEFSKCLIAASEVTFLFLKMVFFIISF